MFITDEQAHMLAEKYGSPLYVYSERILRERCRELKAHFPAEQGYRINYSAKANSNAALLRIIMEEGLDADAMSPGEIFVEQLAGFPAERIFYVCNNVSAEEMAYAADRGILVSVDSLGQLELFGATHPGAKVSVRFNPGAGAGHHEKVVTAGVKTKFGVQKDLVPQVKEIAARHGLKIVGVNQHLGSLFLDEDIYVNGVKNLLEIARNFPGLEFIDFGGGIGVPYRSGEKRMDLAALAAKMSGVLADFRAGYDNKDVIFKIEPGRYVVAECGELLGRVHAVKENYGNIYVGTDIGMNVLMRPALYDSYHEIAAHAGRGGGDISGRPLITATVVGNICETGDIIGKDRQIRAVEAGDIISVGNAGAYGHSMASNYNCRLRPAEVLLAEDGSDRLIRARDTLEDLAAKF